MPPSILLIGNYRPGPAGASTVGHQLADRLRRRGWPVRTTSARAGRAARLTDMVATVWSRRREFEVAQVDVFSGPAFVWAEVVCRSLAWAGKPYILTLHGGGLPAFAARWPSRVRRLLGSAHAVTTPSDYLRAELAGYRGDLRVLPNAIDLEAYRFRPRTSLRPTLVWLRAFHDVYQPDLAPAVIARLRDSYPSVRLAMVGRDEGDGSRERTLRVAEHLGVTSALELPGGVPKSEVPGWLDRGDIFLNTARVDNAPVSILEAMASGLCVVSTNPGGIPHLLRHEADALLAPCGDADALATEVQRLLSDPELATRLSCAGRQRAERHAWPKILPQWEALLTEAARSRAGGP
jgi:glycosyltransferase involved in cell wall biosynthesis